MDRSNYPVHLFREGEQTPDDGLVDVEPAAGMEMAWQLTMQTWEFMGKSLDEYRLQRHVVRIVRSGGSE
jgi:hypothetical protein